ncbi:formyltransferase family protein [Chloroflexus aggregans]|uniref:phosphoribosylglycinamide formyltransferase 1 n=1 Tax=Chloroflexus aggregans (strain MD-66 / DSM 9485) TaxID=326427 RepID=B8GD60_CHLAD|nr:formyltransferase family protein [Chloroflexus aggregans]ACL25127.1 formyl transferase domain protein [Chloroflexus aggregans DSM 9485]
MKVLFLGSSQSPLVEWLQSVGEEVVATMEPIDVAFLDAYSPDFIVSYGYRHIIKKDVLLRYTGRAINLHISYLPWNRGADPNFWSFVEDTPKGVTIHYLNEGVDTGDIIVQKRVTFSESDTLRTSYDKLQEEIQALFKDNWASIRTGECHRKRQQGKGAFYRLKDKERLSHLLTRGWDTPIAVLEEYAAETQMVMQFWDTYDAEINEIRRQGTS